MILKDIVYQNLEIKYSSFILITMRSTIFIYSKKGATIIPISTEHQVRVKCFIYIYSIYSHLKTSRQLLIYYFAYEKVEALRFQNTLKIYIVQKVGLDGSPFAQGNWLHPPFLLWLKLQWLCFKIHLKFILERG